MVSGILMLVMKDEDLINNYLSTLNVSCGDLDPIFDREVNEYIVFVDETGFEDVFMSPIKFNGDYYSHYPLNALSNNWVIIICLEHSILPRFKRLSAFSFCQIFIFRPTPPNPTGRDSTESNTA